MRFLLKSSLSVTVANRYQASKILPSTSNAVSASAPPATSSAENADSTRSKAWGQQCSPNCGCILRFEAQLLESPTKTSPTIVRTSYHAKRVMATVRKTGGGDGATRLTPLTTNQRKNPLRPILTSCTCPALHHLAQRTVDHLPGKTLAQMRNEIDMGVAGARSSVAFRHTVLREGVLPAVAATGDARPGTAKTTRASGDGGGDGADEMNSTHRYGHCYDLVEDSLSSMIRERMPDPRRDADAESYSPTLGGYFRMYSASGRNRPPGDIAGDDVRRQDEDDATGRRGSDLPPFRDIGDWQRKSPSYSFPFGDDSSRGRDASNHSLNITGMLFQNMKDWVNNKLSGGVGSERPASPTAEGDARREERDRPIATYLHLLNTYGADDSSNQDEAEDESAMNDWLVHVDQLHTQGSRSTIG